MELSWEAGRERERGEGRGPDIPSKHTPPMSQLPSTKPHLLKSYHLLMVS